MKTVTITLPLDEAKLLSRLLYEAGDVMHDAAAGGWVNDVAGGNNAAAHALRNRLLDRAFERVHQDPEDKRFATWVLAALLESAVSDAIDLAEKEP